MLLAAPPSLRRSRKNLLLATLEPSLSAAAANIITRHTPAATAAAAAAATGSGNTNTHTFFFQGIFKFGAGQSEGATPRIHASSVQSTTQEELLHKTCAPKRICQPTKKTADCCWLGARSAVCIRIQADPFATFAQTGLSVDLPTAAACGISHNSFSVFLISPPPF